MYEAFVWLNPTFFFRKCYEKATHITCSDTYFRNSTALSFDGGAGSRAERRMKYAPDCCFRKTSEN